MCTINFYLTQIPEDLIRYISSFVYDIRGYNTILYYKNKRDQWLNMLRICIEINEWKKMNVSISWLKPTIIQKKKQKEFLHNLKKGNSEILFHTGVYSNSNDEIDSISNYESFKYLFMPMEIITSINNYKLL